jgi:hypothetical protein
MPPATDNDQLAEDERRAEEVYDRSIRPILRPEDDGKYVAVAVESGDFEIDADDYAATGRLLARHPGARLWLMRTGPSAAYRLRGPVAARPRPSHPGRVYSAP